jgi:hypothetical protein
VLGGADRRGSCGGTNRRGVQEERGRRQRPPQPLMHMNLIASANGIERTGVVRAWVASSRRHRPARDMENHIARCAGGSLEGHGRDEDHVCRRFAPEVFPALHVLVRLCRRLIANEIKLGFRRSIVFSMNAQRWLWNEPRILRFSVSSMLALR